MARPSGIAYWPYTLPPKRVTLTIDRPVFKGPKPLAGREQVVVGDTGGWLVSYEEIPAGGLSEINTLTRHLAVFAGYGNPCYISVAFGQLIPAKRYKLSTSPSGVYLTKAASRRDTFIYFRNLSTCPLIDGDYFEIDGRIHQVAAIYSETLNTETYAQIWPPLRSAYAANTALEIFDPKLLAYIQPDSRANSYTTSMGSFINHNVDFVEASW